MIDAWNQHAGTFPKIKRAFKTVKAEICQNDNVASQHLHDETLIQFALDSGPAYDTRKLFCFLKQKKINPFHCYENLSKIHTTKTIDGTTRMKIEEKVTKPMIITFLKGYNKYKTDKDLWTALSDLRNYYNQTEKKFRLYFSLHSIENNRSY